MWNTLENVAQSVRTKQWTKKDWLAKICTQGCDVQLPWLSSLAPISGVIFYQKWCMEQMKPEKQKYLLCMCVNASSKQLKKRARVPLLRVFCFQGRIEDLAKHLWGSILQNSQLLNTLYHFLKNFLS